ncbi:MAG: gamma carbonic anhydrase family protein [Peptococcaceae bacterium]|jgi:carbonic anhydrase/acetyltransferase-like protein (isoleucine patch superfamily)|nr:gamma carbonic anhydrase family protein [Peptococcaceae bacterium]
MNYAGFMEWEGVRPELAPDVYVARGCQLVGRVEIGPGSSIWFNCVLRGDVAPIRIGSNTNIQDGCTLHGMRRPEVVPVVIGSNVTVGHNAVLHACTIGDASLIGMGAIVLSKAKVGRGALVAAGSMVPENATVPDGVVVMGVPARVVREVTEEERERFLEVASAYRERAAVYKRQPADAQG